MKKKCLLCIISTILLCSCGSKETNQYDKQLYFVFATPLANHPLWLQTKRGFEDACKELNVICDWIGPTAISTEDMEEVYETAILKEVDGIITQGVIRKELIDEARKVGIPTILVDSKIEGANPYLTISKNFKEQAQLLLNDIENTLNDKPFLHIAIQVSNLKFNLALQQIEAVKEVFKDYPGGFEIVDITESKSDKVQSKDEWTKVFERSEDINVALNFAGETAIGCVQAYDKVQPKQRPLIYGVDDMRGTLNYIVQGKIKGSIVTSFYKYGYDSLYFLYNALHDKESNETIDRSANILLVNQNNINTYNDYKKKD
ncbi:MAG: substrate-binding domain-containing protein [Erysipelotrichaceae bacterium]